MAAIHFSGIFASRRRGCDDTTRVKEFVDSRRTPEEAAEHRAALRRVWNAYRETMPKP